MFFSRECIDDAARAARQAVRVLELRGPVLVEVSEFIDRQESLLIKGEQSNKDWKQAGSGGNKDLRRVFVKRAKRHVSDVRIKHAHINMNIPMADTKKAKHAQKAVQLQCRHDFVKVQDGDTATGLSICRHCAKRQTDNSAWKAQQKQKARHRKCQHADVLRGAVACQTKCRHCAETLWNHEFCAHAEKLNVIACIACGLEAAPSPNDSADTTLGRYQSARRKRRYLENLHSLSIPVAGNSFRMIRDLLPKVNVVSNTGVLHITLLEGVTKPSEAYIDSVFYALEHDPTCCVTNLQDLPTNDDTRRLLIANVELPAWTRLSRTTTTQVRLPQWPLHIALGTVPKGDPCYRSLEALKHELIGQILYSNPHSLAWLAPNSRSGNGGSPPPPSRGADTRRAEYRQGPDR